MIKKIFWSFFYRLVAIFSKKEPNTVVFGSWNGESFSDNSRYMAEYIINNYPEYKVYWVGKSIIKEKIEKTNPQIHFLEMNTYNTNKQIAKAEYCFFSQKYHVDISDYNLLHNTKTCYLHHGTPIKKWGDDGLNQLHRTRKIDKVKGKITGTLVDYDYYASSSPLNSEVFCTAMKTFGCTMDKIIPSGTPRNDMLVNYNKEYSKERKEYYSNIIHFSTSSICIMYLPTFRRIEKNIFSLAELSSEDRDKLERLLEKYDAVIMEKSHFAEKVQFSGKSSSRIKFVNQDVNIQEMLLFTDILISDYSSVLLDYLLLDRPIIDFVYDYENYKNIDSGLYYSIEEYYAGEIVTNFDELLIALEKILAGVDDFKERRREMRNKYMEYEQGKASETLFNAIIGNSRK